MKEYIDISLDSREVVAAYTLKERSDWYFGENHASADENYREIATDLFLDVNNFFRPTQTLGDNVVVVTEDMAGEGVIKPETYEADGIITDIPRIVLCLIQSDCPPVYFYDPVHHAIGLAHSGRQGTRLNIVSKVVELMKKTYESKPEDMQVAIGPHICSDCYEIQSDVENEFVSTFPEASADQILLKKDGRTYLNLDAAITYQLIKCGIPDKNIRHSDICTYEDEKLYSYRLGDGTKSNLSLISLRDMSLDDYHNWVQYDGIYNNKPAWTKEEYPESQYGYMKQVGCFLFSECIMLRRFGLEKEDRFEYFNPMIFYNRMKEIKAFDEAANLNPNTLSQFYPISYAGDIDFSMKALKELLDENQPCLLMVPGRNGLYHYIVPDRIDGDEVYVIDCGWDKKKLSEFEKVFYLAIYKRN